LKKTCNKCGACCYPRKKINNKIIINYTKKCPYMNNDNTCSVYENRFQKSKEKNITCLKRNQIKINFPNCPYNDK
jgi:uncharacterized cysteine cluster protein YcgN (CxxCxxCC family)